MFAVRRCPRATPSSTLPPVQSIRVLTTWREDATFVHITEKFVIRSGAQPKPFSSVMGCPVFSTVGHSHRGLAGS
jgi:hypothetical protein